MSHRHKRFRSLHSRHNHRNPMEDVTPAKIRKLEKEGIAALLDLGVYATEGPTLECRLAAIETIGKIGYPPALPYITSAISRILDEARYSKPISANVKAVIAKHRWPVPCSFIGVTKACIE